jgi:hypothetical protein
MNKSIRNVAIALATVALGATLIGGNPVFASDSQNKSSVTVSVNVTNLPAGLTQASKIADPLILRLCPQAAGTTSAPATPSCTDDKYSYEINGDTARIIEGVFAGSASVKLPSTDTIYAAYLVFQKTGSLGLAATTSTGSLITLTSTTTGPVTGPSLALPAATAVSNGSSKDGKSVSVNLTVTGVPAKYTKTDSLKDAVKALVCPLTSDASTAPATAPSTCTSKQNGKDVSFSALAAGIATGTVSLPTPSATTNYAVYLTVAANKDTGFAAQTGAGQFVTVTVNGKAGAVSAGLDGLTLSLSANTGTAVIDKSIAISVPATGTWAVMISKSGDKGKTSIVDVLPITAGATKVAIPSTYDSGTYTAQLIQLGGTGTFTLDKNKNLTAVLSLTQN